MLINDSRNRKEHDTEWMTNLILIAKNALVWLSQLTQKYGREIRRLDQIPDEEFRILADQGFTGLWLIGIWRRSIASQTIKHLSGNLDARASAYSLMEYEIDEELGGREALLSLKTRAMQFGIRLACDIVPNHTAIDSNWLFRHPDWFIQSDKPPFDSYSFAGKNLSHNKDFEIRIEDHYSDRTDASVVFQLIEAATGRKRYIYHGNDGTSFPWNDTAQLNYLLPEVREAVIAEIIRLAKIFPIIRFDAAMTLTKEHFQRLWFPKPESDCNIPSRSESSLSLDQFNKLMPKEFWHEVVERVHQEVPGTLLLAEAFWMMEDYFVRSLGMHRVYNSSFMHMLKQEDNSNFRQSVRMGMDFSRNILKKYVNFLSNPDEKPASIQFGKEDKYFGCCVLMVTLPGLPMFGHGQIQGLDEHYGMEFYEPRLDEIEDPVLLERHVKEIFPLMRQRNYFSETTNFHLFDFSAENRKTNENVFVFSNEYNHHPVLVIFNNHNEATMGNVLKSYSPGQVIHETPGQLRQHFAGIFHLSDAPGYFLRFKESVQGIEYILPYYVILRNGFPVSLAAYEYRVYLDFEEVREDEDHPWKKLYEQIGIRGTENLDIELQKILSLGN